MMHKSLTETEKRVIRAFKANDIVSDNGWDHPYAATWIKGFHQDCGITSVAFPGVISSLVKKGVIVTNGESFALTDKGREVAAQL